MYDIQRSPWAQTVEADRHHVWHHMTQHAHFRTQDPRIIVEGQGMRLWDQTGREYLDAASGAVWVVNVGYGRERIANAMRDQALKMNFFVSTAGTVPAAELAKRLTEKTPGLTRAFFGSSGSEANEKAFKLVRQIAHQHHGGRKWKILYRERDYHGTTFAALAASGQAERSARFGPLAPGFIPVPHCLEYRAQWETDDYGQRAADAIEEVILREGPDTIGALCLEPITAGGGAITPPDGYWPRVQEICKKYDILLHLDEVVCGMGRTGTWFGYQNYGIQPDIVTCAKGLASGYAPISVMLTTEGLFDLFTTDPEDPLSPFRDVSTYAGCTIGPAAALENMAIIEEEGLLRNTQKMGELLMEQLLDLQEKHPIIGDVRGKGLFAGVELVSDRISKEPLPEASVTEIHQACDAEGVILGRTNRAIPGHNNTICFSPALIATAEDITRMTETLDAAITRL